MTHRGVISFRDLITNITAFVPLMFIAYLRILQNYHFLVFSAKF